MSFVMDEFDDESIDPMWVLLLDRPGVAVTETAAGDFEWYCDTACLNEWYRQTVASVKSFDIYSKLTIPTRAEVIGSDTSLGIWYAVGNNYNYADIGFWFSTSSASYYGEDCTYSTEVPYPFSRQFTLWIDGWHDINRDDSEYNCIDYQIPLGDDQNTVWVRYRYRNKKLSYFYALSEPLSSADWILAYKDFPIDMDDEDPYLGFSQWGSSGNDTDKTFKIAYVREWPSESVEPPSLDQYQRLQGYPKVTHPLVFNRNTGDFEVMHQPKPAAPLPIVEGSDILAYDGSGNLSTITRTIGGITYVKTLTYTAGDLTYISNWVEQ